MHVDNNRMLTPVGRNVLRISLATPTLPPATDTNTYLITEGTDLIVVEPATPYPAERAMLAEAISSVISEGFVLRGAIVTHHHNDHVGAAEWLAAEFGVGVWAHARTKSKLSGRVNITRVLSDGERLLDGTVTVMHTPGHAPGHLCLHGTKQRWAIVGDMVASVGTIVIDPDDDGDMRVYLEQLTRLAGCEFDVLLPAHGGEVNAPQQLLTFYISHRLKREQRVIEALSHDWQSIEAIVARAYVDTPAELWPIAKKSAHAHLLKLRDEEVSETIDDGGGLWRLRSGRATTTE
jgi:glyoxylase-like metal-dependent hydrolase (beta-lactamase superfamily II)